MDKISMHFMVLKSDDIEPLYFNPEYFRNLINFMVNLHRLFTIFQGSTGRSSGVFNDIIFVY